MRCGAAEQVHGAGRAKGLRFMPASSPYFYFMPASDSGRLRGNPAEVPSAVEIPGISGQEITKVTVRTLQSGDH